MKGLLDFMRAQGIVGMAVALAVGIAAANAVSSIVSGFINPVVGWILGGSNLVQETWTVVEASADRPALIFSWGSIAASVINLFAVAFVTYYVVIKLRLDKKK